MNRREKGFLGCRGKEGGGGGGGRRRHVSVETQTTGREGGDCKGRRRRRVTAGGVCGGGVASDSGRGKSSVSSWSMDALRRMLVQGRGRGRGLLPHFFAFGWRRRGRRDGGRRGFATGSHIKSSPPLLIPPPSPPFFPSLVAVVQ